MPTVPAALASWFQHPSSSSPVASPPLAEEDRPTPPPEPVERGDLSGRGPRRPAAPFPPVESGAIDASAIPRAAKRTLTRRDYPIKNPTEPSQSPAGVNKSSPEASKDLAAASQAPVAMSKDPMEATPPAIVTAAPSGERPRVPSGAVARGEIQIAAPLPLSKKLEKSGKPNAPSVLVELGAVPQHRTAATVD